MKTFDQFVDSVKLEGEEIIKTTLPRKIDELSQLLKSEEFDFELQRKSLLQAVDTPTPDLLAMKRALKNPGNDSTPLPSTPIPCNASLVKLIELARPVYMDLAKTADTLSLWLLHLIPKVEDGNNFGVEIQTETLNDISNAERSSLSCIASLEDYFKYRGDLVDGLVNNPFVEDRRRGIVEYDKNEFHRLLINIRQIRYQYTRLYYKITKNLEKIKRPKTSNNETMY